MYDGRRRRLKGCLMEYQCCYRMLPGARPRGSTTAAHRLGLQSHLVS